MEREEGDEVMEREVMERGREVGDEEREVMKREGGDGERGEVMEREGRDDIMYYTDLGYDSCSGSTGVMH